MRALRMRTGFSEGELFRKYLWYLLRERKFDADAVADLLHLRAALALTDEQVRGPGRVRKTKASRCVAQVEYVQ